MSECVWQHTGMNVRMCVTTYRNEFVVLKKSVPNYCSCSHSTPHACLKVMLWALWINVGLYADLTYPLRWNQASSHRVPPWKYQFTKFRLAAWIVSCGLWTNLPWMRLLQLTASLRSACLNEAVSGLYFMWWASRQEMASDMGVIK
jgi:hypothetical protein